MVQDGHCRPVAIALGWKNGTRTSQRRRLCRCRQPSGPQLLKGLSGLAA